MAKTAEKKRGPGRPPVKAAEKIVPISAGIPAALEKQLAVRQRKESLTRSAAVTAALRAWLG